MHERRGPGMDHPHYPFSAAPARPVLHWPDAARVALWVVIHLEHWEIDAPPDAVRDRRLDGELGSYYPDYLNFSRREYGNRVGVFRVLDVLDRHRIKATVAANAAACQRYPRLVDAFAQRGYEFAAGGTHAMRMITSLMPEHEERATIASAIEAIRVATGCRPRGWIGQDYGESTRTPRLLAEAGLEYVGDWPNDDQPYRMTVGRPLVSLPCQAEWDDIQMLKLRRMPQPRYPELVEAAFRTLHQEGAGSGRTFCLSIHPWILGQPHRIRYLDEALERIAAFGAVWQATAGDIARWFLDRSSELEHA